MARAGGALLAEAGVELRAARSGRLDDGSAADCWEGGFSEIGHTDPGAVEMHATRKQSNARGSRSISLASRDSAPPPRLTADQVPALSLTELRTACRLRGLDASGKANALGERLRTALLKEAEQEAMQVAATLLDSLASKAADAEPASPASKPTRASSSGRAKVAPAAPPTAAYPTNEQLAMMTEEELEAFSAGLGLPSSAKSRNAPPTSGGSGGSAGGSSDGDGAALAPAPSAPPKGTLEPTDLAVGEIVYYKHRTLGFIQVEVTKVDYRGAFDGGVTFLISAPELADGVVETVRKRLFRTLEEVEGVAD